MRPTGRGLSCREHIQLLWASMFPGGSWKYTVVCQQRQMSPEHLRSRSDAQSIGCVFTPLMFKPGLFVMIFKCRNKPVCLSLCVIFTFVRRVGLSSTGAMHDGINCSVSELVVLYFSWCIMGNNGRHHSTLYLLYTKQTRLKLQMMLLPVCRMCE